jgi:hypothetical protein
MSGLNDGYLGLDMLAGFATAPNKIVATDYENYSIVYSCADYWWADAEEYLLIYTRDPTHTDEAFALWNDIV